MGKFLQAVIMAAGFAAVAAVGFFLFMLSRLSWGPCGPSFSLSGAGEPTALAAGPVFFEGAAS